MPRCDDLVHLGFRRLVQLFRQRLILNRRDRILRDIVARDREKLLHRRQRNINPLITPVVISAPDLLRDPYHLKSIAVQRD